MRNITNERQDSQILDLGSGGKRGPYLITQTGCDPRAELPKTHLFVLRPDGQWVDFNAYACQGKPEAMDEIVFAGMTDVMAIFGRMIGRPRVLHLTVDKAGLESWIARQKDKDPLRAAQEWAVRYNERQGTTAGA